MTDDTYSSDAIHMIAIGRRVIQQCYNITVGLSLLDHRTYPTETATTDDCLKDFQNQHEIRRFGSPHSLELDYLSSKKLVPEDVPEETE